MMQSKKCKLSFLNIFVLGPTLFILTKNALNFANIIIPQLYNSNMSSCVEAWRCPIAWGEVLVAQETSGTSKLPIEVYCCCRNPFYVNWFFFLSLPQVTAPFASMFVAMHHNVTSRDMEADGEFLTWRKCQNFKDKVNSVWLGLQNAFQSQSEISCTLTALRTFASRSSTFWSASSCTPSSRSTS